MKQQEQQQEIAQTRAKIAQLHETLYPKVVRYAAVRIGDFAEAEDLASEVFVRALRAAGSFKETGPPMEAWIFRIAHNLVVDHLRSRSRKPQQERIDEVEWRLTTPEGDPEAMAERDAESAALRAAISQLTEAQQQVLAHRLSDADMTSEQIAEVLGKRPTAVREMQSAAIKRLRSILGASSGERGGHAE